jgi:quinol monooxygenase YgiN
MTFVVIAECRGAAAPDRFTLYEECTAEAGFQAHTETQHFERRGRGEALLHLTERRIHKLVPAGPGIHHD